MNEENSKAWFLFEGGQVSGPVSITEIKQMAATGVKPGMLIWIEEKGQWEPLDQWLKPARSVLPDCPVDIWHYAVGPEQKGPLPLKDLVEMIKAGQIPLNAKFWTPGLQHWVGLEALPQVVEGSGLLRRKNPRAPLFGSVEVKGFPHEPAVTAVTVSEGGIGLKNLAALGVGSKIMITIKSPHFTEPVASKAEILFQQEVFSSLKFHELHEKAKLALTEYVRSYKAG